MRSIYFELQIFCRAIGPNTKVSFGEATGKKSDVHVECNGVEFNIECKSLRNEANYQNAALHFHQLLQVILDKYDKMIIDSDEFIAIEIKDLNSLKDAGWRRNTARLFAEISTSPTSVETESISLILAEPGGVAPDKFCHKAMAMREARFGPLEMENVYIHIAVQSVEKVANLGLFFVRTQPTTLRERIRGVVEKAFEQTAGLSNPVLCINLESANFNPWPLNQDMAQHAIATAETCWDELRKSRYANNFSWIGICQQSPPKTSTEPNIIHDPVTLDFRRGTDLSQRVEAVPFINPINRMFL